MKYNRPQATASWGTMAKDWEQGIDYDRLSQGAADAGAGRDPPCRARARVLCFNFDNIRYITGTHIGEWARDKFMRYALCPAEGAPFLWDPAPPAKRISSPWIADNVAAPISTMQGALAAAAQRRRATSPGRSRRRWCSYGIDKEPIGIDMMELPMLRALEEEGIEVVDGQQAMLDAREVKTAGRDRAPEDGRRHGRRDLCRHRPRDPARHARERTGRDRQRPAVPHGLGARRMRQFRVRVRAAGRTRTPSPTASSSRAT